MDKETLWELREFIYEDKFKMSFDNVLIFTGQFENSSGTNLIGKNLYIPLTERHPAFTSIITRQSWKNSAEVSSLMIQFNSEEEREVVASCDFTGDVFFVDP